MYAFFARLATYSETLIISRFSFSILLHQHVGTPYPTRWDTLHNTLGHLAQRVGTPCTTCWVNTLKGEKNAGEKGKTHAN